MTQMLKLCSHLILLSSLCILLTSCGFHLRGQNALAPQIHVLYLKSNNPYGLFEARLRKTFNMYGITFVDDPEQTPLTLQIEQSNLSYFQTTVGSSSQATIYSVSYKVIIAITDSSGKIIVPSKNIDSDAFLTLNPNQLLTSNNQIDILGQQLQLDVINRIVDILNSPEVGAALANGQNSPPKSKIKQHRHRHSHHEN